MVDTLSNSYGPATRYLYPQGIQKLRASLFTGLLPVLDAIRRDSDVRVLEPLAILEEDFDASTVASTTAIAAAKVKSPFITTRPSSLRLYDLLKEESTKTRIGGLVETIATAIRARYGKIGGVQPASCYFLPGNDVEPCWVDWHTKADAPGWRIEMSHIPFEGKSFFAWADREGKITYDHDVVGWNFRLFFAKPLYDPFWHSIYTEVPRFSVTFDLGIIKYEAVREFLKSA